jgi:hypothetical protein
MDSGERMIEPSELRKEFNKIRAIGIGKGSDPNKVNMMMIQLRSFIMDDVACSADQRTRLLLKMLYDFDVEVANSKP